MKKLVLSALMVTGAIASSAIIAEIPVKMPYEEQIALISEDFTNTLSPQALNRDNNHAIAMDIIAKVKDVINIQAKNPTIVPAATKAKLMAAVNRIQTTLDALQGKKSIDEHINTVKNAIKALQANLKTLKTGVLDIYKTPTDLKNAVHKAVGTLIASLERWLGNAELMSVGLDVQEDIQKQQAAEKAKEQNKRLLEPTINS